MVSAAGRTRTATQHQVPHRCMNMLFRKTPEGAPPELMVMPLHDAPVPVACKALSPYGYPLRNSPFAGL